MQMQFMGMKSIPTTLSLLGSALAGSASVVSLSLVFFAVFKLTN